MSVWVLAVVCRREAREVVRAQVRRESVDGGERRRRKSCEGVIWVAGGDGGGGGRGGGWGGKEVGLGGRVQGRLGSVSRRRRPVGGGARDGNGDWRCVEGGDAVVGGEKGGRAEGRVVMVENGGCAQRRR